MFKIEFQYWSIAKDNWIKGKHKLYESEKSFKTYWDFHKKDQAYFASLSDLPRRMVGFKNGKQIDIYEP